MNNQPLTDFRKYSNECYLQPLWKGNVIYNESVLFFEEKDGTVNPVSLLYNPKEIIAVLSDDLKTEYKNGVDFYIKDGKMYRTENSAIPAMKYEEYYPSEYIKDRSFGCTKGNYIMYAPLDEITKYQAAVTYTHEDTWEGPVPEYQGNKLPKTMEKLKGNKPITIAFNGDSIMVGANSSGWEAINKPPYAPIWVDMFMEKLKSHYNLDKVSYTNTAVGGMATNWGLENVDTLVNQYNPDLAIIGFGMNDAGFLTVDQYIANTKGIIDSILNKNPECEIILISTTLPNEEAAGFFTTQPLQEAELVKLANQYEHIAVCKMTQMHSYLLTKKLYRDMTGNNINHPNDFLARVYAQVMAKLLIENF